MNERRDELALKVDEAIDNAMGDAIGIYTGQLHTPWQAVLGQTTEDIIALVTAARDAEIRDALLQASYSHEVADKFNFMHPDKESEEYVEFDRPVTIGTIHAAAEILLDHIGLTAEGAER